MLRVGCLVCTALAGTADAQWSEWNHSMTITFRGYTRSEPLTNFPALVVLSETIPGFRYSDFRSSGYSELRFVNSSGTELYYEVDEWNVGSESYIWVQVPRLAGSNDFITAHWGRTGQSQPSYTTNGNAWEASYGGVWHLNETGGSPDLTDSSGNHNDGTAQRAGVANDAGIVSDGVYFLHNGANGNAGYVSIPDSASLQRGSQPVTLEAWIHIRDGDQANWCNVVEKGSYNDREYGFARHHPGSGVAFELGTAGANWFYNWSTNGHVENADVPRGTHWHYLVGTLDSSGDGNYYADGVLEDDVPDAAEPVGVYSTANPLVIGQYGVAPWDWPTLGVVDEVRVAMAERSSNWVWASYVNAVSNDEFMSYHVPGAYAGRGFARTVQIQARGYDRGETLRDFPMLVKFSEAGIPGFDYGEFLSLPHDDLRFSNDDGSRYLNHEVEEWNTGGTSYVWVQVPELGSTNDCIRAYWGKAGESSPAYTTNGDAWDRSYVGVWHLDQASGSPDLADSSGFGHQGYSRGAGVSNVTGAISDGQAFKPNTGSGPGWIYVSNSVALTRGSQPVTLEQWVKVNYDQGTWTVINEKGDYGHTREYGFARFDPDGRLDFEFDLNGAQHWHFWESAGVDKCYLSQGTGWRHVVGTYKPPDKGKIYIDGQLVLSQTQTVPGYRGSQAFSMGMGAGNVVADETGSALDEMRISMATRSSNWVWASYMNVVSNDTFCQYFAAESAQQGLLFMMR